MSSLDNILKEGWLKKKNYKGMHSFAKTKIGNWVDAKVFLFNHQHNSKTP